MTTTFYLVRHGETGWNQEQRFRGRKDVELSEEGIRQAMAVADALEFQGIDLIFASPLSRAMVTLAPLAGRLNRDVVPLPEIIDMDFGEWEGLLVSEVEQKWPDLFKFWSQSPQDVVFPGGESLPLVQARGMRAISRMAVENPDKKIAICSHRVVTKLIILGLLGVRPDKFWAIRQDTACINKFTFHPPHAVIHTVNDTRHLDKISKGTKPDF